MTPKEDSGDRKRPDRSPLLERANAAYDAGDHLRALSLFDEVIEAGMDNEVVHNNKGAALDALGMYERATESYRAAVRRAPGYELAWHNLGNCLYSRELYEEAAEAYGKASSLNPSRLENFAGLANSYSKLGKVRRTKAALKRLVEAGPSSGPVRLMAAEIFLDLGLSVDAVDMCLEHIRLQGESTQALSVLGTAYHEAGDFAHAAQTFEKALTMSPNNKELLNNLGYSLFCAGFLEPALSAFDKSLAIDPGYKHAWYNKGYSLHGAERLAEALECYEKALEIDPMDRVLWNNYGNALYNLGRFEESIPKFVEALRVDPDYEIAWNNIGNALEKIGMWLEAIPFHDRSLEIRPDFDYALYAKGICLSMTGRPEEGYDLVLESITLNPDYDEAWKARSRIARQLGRWDEALSSIEESLAVNPGYADGWADRGDILSATGDLVGAEASYRTALRHFPPMRNGSQGESAMLRRKAEVLLRLGRFEEAFYLLGDAMTARAYDPGIASEFIRGLKLSSSTPIPEGLHSAMERTDDPDVLLDYCELLLDRGRHDDALKVLEGLPEAGEHAERAAYLEAQAYWRAGLPEDEVLGLLSGMSCELVCKFRGELAEAHGDMAKAESEYAQLLESRPNDYQAAESLARVRLRLGNAKGALDAARTALGIDSSEPGAAALVRRANDAIRRGGSDKAPEGEEKGS
ncbi:MAG: tetratricopeptide repeat protein [Thermoplasmata archaeon]